MINQHLIADLTQKNKRGHMKSTVNFLLKTMAQQIMSMVGLELY